MRGTGGRTKEGSLSIPLPLIQPYPLYSQTCPLSTSVTAPAHAETVPRHCFHTTPFYFHTYCAATWRKVW